MAPAIATVVYILGIVALFLFDRDENAHTSKALWIPVIWLLINGSRPVSEWLQTGPTISQIQTTPRPVEADLYLDGSPLDAAVWAILLAIGIAVLFSRREQVWTLLRANGPILLFFSYCALSIVWSDYPFVAFKRWIKAAGDVVMILIVLTDLNPSFAIKRFISRAGFLLIPVSVLFIKYFPNLGRSYNPWTWIPVYGGVTTFKNLLGMTCLICGLGSLWCFVAAYRDKEGTHRIRHLIAHGVILVMVLWLFWMADSMTSLSCFIMAGGVMIMASQVRLARKQLVVHILVAVVVLVSALALFLDASAGLVGSLGRDPTLTGRSAIWNAVLSLDHSPLLGTGYESFWLGKRLQEVLDLTKMKGIQEAHNGYLEIYLNLGWVGITLLAVLIMAGYRNVITMFRRDPKAGGIRLAFFVVAVVYSFTEAGFKMLAPVWTCFLLAVMAVPIAPVPERPRRAGADQTPAGRLWSGCPVTSGEISVC